MDIFTLYMHILIMVVEDSLLGSMCVCVCVLEYLLLTCLENAAEHIILQLLLVIDFYLFLTILISLHCFNPSQYYVYVCCLLDVLLMYQPVSQPCPFFERNLPVSQTHHKPLVVVIDNGRPVSQPLDSAQHRHDQILFCKRLIYYFTMCLYGFIYLQIMSLIIQIIFSENRIFFKLVNRSALILISKQEEDQLFQPIQIIQACCFQDLLILNRELYIIYIQFNFHSNIICTVILANNH